MRNIVFAFLSVVALYGCSHADKRPDLKIATSNQTHLPPHSGETYSAFLIGSPKYENDCDGYRDFYEMQLKKPIGTDEKKAIAVWGDLYLCLCHEAKERGHEKLNNIETENQDTGCKLKPDHRKYGVYVNLALRINERFNGGSMPPLVHYLHCARRRLQGELISDVALVSCLNEM